MHGTEILQAAFPRNDGGCYASSLCFSFHRLVPLLGICFPGSSTKVPEVKMQLEDRVDALIVGAGFAGICQLRYLQQLRPELDLKLIDALPDLGGTWYSNIYPGAMSDTESYAYRFSWDKEIFRTYPWQRRYLRQPEILEYLRHVVRHWARAGSESGP